MVWIKRKWGDYCSFYGTENTRVKILRFEDGKTSKQRHRYRDEIWTVLRGTVVGTVNFVPVKYTQGQTFRIPSNQWHELGGPSGTEVVEIWVGPILREDDIERSE